MKRNNVLVAVTGGIGSGKSAALQILKDQGYATFSCDKEVAALYKKRRVLKKLKPAFPTAITGKIKLSADKKEIARLCFSDDQKLDFLHKILSGPALARALKKGKKTAGVAFVEVPLLYECGAEKLFDKVIVIKREKAARIAAVKTRSALTEKDVLKRIEKQIDYDAFDFKSAIVIEKP